MNQQQPNNEIGNNDTGDGGCLFFQHNKPSSYYQIINIYFLLCFLSTNIQMGATFDKQGKG